MKKEWALLKAFFHWIICGDTIIRNSGKSGEWMPVTKIFCGKCGKVFYELKTKQHEK